VLYKVTPKKTHEPDAIDALIFCIGAIVAVPAAAWMLAAIFNAAFF
jgi:hypothetical protein